MHDRMMEHSAWLKDNCRVCGGKLKKFKVSYDCHTEPNRLKLHGIGVSVENDNKETHPQRFCHACYNVCTRACLATRQGKDYTPKLKKFDWVAHVDGCSICTHFGEMWKGRKPKKVSTGRPSHKQLELVSTLKAVSPPSIFSDEKFRVKLSEVQHDLQCPLCLLVVERPLLLTTCTKIVCSTCCISHIYQHPDLSCPFCGPSHILDSSSVVPAPPMILKLLRNIETRCEKCNEQVSAGSYSSHSNA